MDNRKNYRVCLSDWCSILPKLCSLIDTPYNEGDFNSFERAFISSGKNEFFWKVSGKSGCDILIELEKYEGYFFGTLGGSGNTYLSGVSLLWGAYLAQGGNPETQEKPGR